MGGEIALRHRAATAGFALLATLAGVGPLEGQSFNAGPTVSGQVVDHETDEPVRSAAVSLGAGPTGTAGVGTRVTDEAGEFLFSDVPPGAYRLSVTVLGYRDMVDTSSWRALAGSPT